MNDFTALWAHCLMCPLDAAPRLILSDWCEEFTNDYDLVTGLRTKYLPVADAKCHYRRKKKRSEYILNAVRQFGASQRLSQGLKMSLTYTNGGVYDSRIVKWGLSESKEKKTPQVFFTILILAEIDGKGEKLDCPSYERTIYQAITDNTVDRLVDDIARLGVDLESFSQLDPESPKAVSFEGIEVQVKCKHETYQGKTNERFSFNFGSTIATMAKEGVGKLDALFGSRLKPVTKATTSPAKPKAAAKTPTEKEAEEVF